MPIAIINNSDGGDSTIGTVASRSTEVAARLGRRLLLWARSDGARILPLLPWCIVKVGGLAYDLGWIVQAALMPPQRIDVPGLRPEVAQKLYEELEKNITSIDLMIPLKPICFKKSVVVRLVIDVLQHVDRKYLEKITRADIERIFKDDFTSAIVQFVQREEVGAIEEQLELLISGVVGAFGGLSAQGGRLLQRLNVVKTPKGTFLFEVNKSEGDAYTVKLFSGEGVNSDTLLDGLQELPQVCLYEGVSVEKLRELKNFLHSFQEEGQLAYTLKNLPETVAEFFGVPLRVGRGATLDNGMFRSESLLRIVRQQLVEDVFNGDALEADKTLFSIRIAELATYFLQNESELSVDECTRLLKKASTLRSELVASYDFPEKRHHIDTLTHLSLRARRRLLKALVTKPEVGEEEGKSVIPTSMRPLFNAIFSSFGTSSVLTKNIAEGVSRALGTDFSNLIEAARADYLAHGGEVQQEGDESMSLASRTGIIVICGFVQYILFDLLTLAGITLIGSGGAAGIASMALAAAISAEVYELIPEEQRKMYVEIRDSVMYCMVPLIIEWGYRLFVSEALKKEVQWRIQVIDACSFQSTASHTSAPAIEEELAEEIRGLQGDARGVIDRLNESNRAFREQLAREMEETHQPREIAAPPLSYLSVIERRVSYAAEDSRAGIEAVVEDDSDETDSAAGVGGTIDSEEIPAEEERAAGGVDVEAVVEEDFDSEEAALSFLAIGTGAAGELPESPWVTRLRTTITARLEEGENIRPVEKVEPLSITIESVETVDSVEAMQKQLQIWADVAGAFPPQGDRTTSALLQSAFTRYRSMGLEFDSSREEQRLVFDVIESKQAPSELASRIKKMLPNIESLTETTRRDGEAAPSAPRPEGIDYEPEPLPPARDGVVQALSGFAVRAAHRVEQVSRASETVRRSAGPLFTGEVRRIEAPALLHGPLSSGYWEEVGEIFEPSEADLIAAHKTITDIGKVLSPPDTISSPDEFFAYFRGIEEVFRDQMGVMRMFTRERQDPPMYKSCMGAIRNQLTASLQAIEPLFNGIEDGLFDEAKWSKEHTNELCRVVRIVSEMYAASASRFKLRHKSPLAFEVDARGWLYQAALLFLAEELLSREERKYKNGHLSLQLICSIQEQGCLSTFSPRDRSLYSKLAETHAEDPATETSYEERRYRARDLLQEPWWLRLYSAGTDDHPMHIAKQVYTIADGIEWYLKPPREIIHELEHRAERGWWRKLPIVGDIQRAVADVWSKPWKSWLEERETFLPQPLHDLYCAISATPVLKRCKSLSDKHIEIGYGTNRIDQAGSVYTSEEKEPWKLGLTILTPSFFENVVSVLEELGGGSAERLAKSLPSVVKFALFDWVAFEERLSSDSVLCGRLLRACLVINEHFEEEGDRIFASALNEGLSNDSAWCERVVWHACLVISDLPKGEGDMVFACALEVAKRNHPDIDEDLVIKAEARIPPRNRIAARFLYLARKEERTWDEVEQLHAHAMILIEMMPCVYTPQAVNLLVYEVYPDYVENMKSAPFLRRVIEELLFYMPEHNDVRLDEYVIAGFEKPVVTLTKRDNRGETIAINLSKMEVDRSRARETAEVEEVIGSLALPFSQTRLSTMCLEDPSLKATISRGAEGVFSVLVFRGDEAIFERELPAKTSPMAVRNGIIIPKEPYFLVHLQEFPRPHPTIYTFARGKRLECYRAGSNQYVYSISQGEKRVLFLQTEEGELKCLTHGEMTLSDNQSIPGSALVGPHIVLRRNGHRFALTETKPIIVGAAPALVDETLVDAWSDVKKILTLVPEFSALFFHLRLSSEAPGFSLFALDKEGRLIPRSTEEYATVLFASLVKRDDSFSRHVHELIREIQLQAPPQGSLSVTHMCAILAAVRIAGKAPVETTPLILQLLLTQMQAIELSPSSKERKQERALLLACTLPIYVSYLELGLCEAVPIPEVSEVIFLQEAFIALEEAVIAGEKESPLLIRVSGVLQEGIKPLFFSLFSRDTAKRLAYLDAKYEKPETPTLTQLAKRLACSMLTREPKFPLLRKVLGAPRRFTWLMIQQAAFRALEASEVWSNWFGKGVPKALTDIAYESLSNAEATKYAKFLTELLIDEQTSGSEEERRVAKAHLMHRLQGLVVPNASDYRALRLLQYISRRVEEGSLPTRSGDQDIEQYVLRIEREMQAGDRGGEGILSRAGAQLKGVTKQYATLDTTTLLCGGAVIAGIPSSVAWSLSLGMLGVEVAADSFGDGLAMRQGVARPRGAYPSLRHIVEEHAFLQGAFESLGEKHFTRGQTPGEAPYELRLDRPDAYTQERVVASFEALRARSGEIPTYEMQTSQEALREEIGQFDTALRAHVDTMRSDICAMVNKSTVCAISIDELFAYAVETDGALRLQSRLTCSLSVAECIMGRMVYLALYESYLVKTRLVLEAIDRGEELTRISHTHGKDDRTDVDDLSRECEKCGLSAVGAILFDTKHYEISEGSDERYVIGCLIFEARSGMWLRPLQAKQMHCALLGGGESVVVEMIPGSGKTAFGAILSLHYKWKHGEVALAVFTKELVASTKREVAERYFRLTGRSAFFFSIDRTKEDHISLQHILLRCEASRDRGDVIITSKEDMQALELLFIETLHTLSTKLASSYEYRAALKQLPYLQRIIAYISNAHMVVDECHEILRPDELEVYPIGDEVAIDTTHIFGAELVFKHILEKLRLKEKEITDFVEDHALFNRVMQGVTFAIASDRFFGVSDEQKEELARYFSEKSMRPPAWLPTHPRFAEAAMVRGVCIELLPTKSEPSGDEEKSHATYGRASDAEKTKYAIPYAGNGKPIDDAIFQSPHETLVKTYLLYLQTGLSKQEVQKLRETCIKRAKEEVEEGGISIEETPLMRYYADHFGDIDDAHEPLMDNQEAILLYVTLHIGPTIRYYPTSMESTSMDFAAMAKKGEYFSGTIYNKSVYPVGLRYCRSEETTAQTLSAVGKSIREGAGGVTTLPSEDSRGAFITQVAGDADCMMAIDAGALFNGVPNREVARKLAEACKESRPEIKAIVFFESDDTMWVREIESGNVARYAPKALKPEERLCYLDQTHTFGVDIPQKPGAGSHITVGRNILAQIEQASWRLRGLASMGQYVRLTLLPEAKRDMDEMELPETFEGTVQYLLTAEQNKLKKHTLQATLHAIRSTVRSVITRKLAKVGQLGKTMQVFNEFSDLFVAISSLSPVDLYADARDEIDPKQYIASRIAHWRRRMEKSSAFSEEERREILGAFGALQPDILPEIMHVVGERGDAHFSGVRIRQRTEHRVQQREKHKEKISTSPPRVKVKPSTFRPWPDIDLGSMDWMYLPSEDSHPPIASVVAIKGVAKGSPGSMPCDRLTRVAQSFTLPHWHTFAKLFSDELLITANVLPVEVKGTGWRLSSFTEWLMFDSVEKGASKKVMDVLFVWNKETNKRTIIGLGCADALVWEVALKEKATEGELCYALCKVADGTLLNRAKIDPELCDFVESEEGKRFVLMWKVFNCGYPTTAAERSRFKSLCDNVLSQGIRIDELIEAVRAIAAIRQPHVAGTHKLVACIKQLYGDNKHSTLLL